MGWLWCNPCVYNNETQWNDKLEHFCSETTPTSNKYPEQISLILVEPSFCPVLSPPPRWVEGDRSRPTTSYLAAKPQFPCPLQQSPSEPRLAPLSFPHYFPTLT